MKERSYTMTVEEDTTNFYRPVVNRVVNTGTSSQYLYNACPRCKDGTLYSPPNIKDFSCVVCGWQQKCRNCFGEVVMRGSEKVCTSCYRSDSVGNSSRG